MIEFWDYHTHHNRCNHAEENLSAYIEAAIGLGLEEIGVSDHWPMQSMPNNDVVSAWAMELNSVPNYLEEAFTLRKTFAEKINVKIASEVDYCTPVFPIYQSQIKPFLSQLDYLIGSVHVIQRPNGDYIPIDGPNNPKIMDEIGIDNFYHIYYNELQRMAKTNYFQIVGHFDLPKKYGVKAPDTVWQDVLDTLDAVEETGMCVEINTAGLRKKVKEQYPSVNIIQEIIERKIPITLGSDAHKPHEVGYHFPEVYHNLKSLSQKLNCPVYLAKFSKQQRILVKLS